MTALAHVGPVPLEETVAAIAPVIAVTGRGYLAALRTRMRSARAEHGHEPCRDSHRPGHRGQPFAADTGHDAVVLDVNISLDGFVAGPRSTPGESLGESRELLRARATSSDADRAPKPHRDRRHAHRRAPTKDSIGAALEHTRRTAGDCDVRIAAPGATDLHDAVAR